MLLRKGVPASRPCFRMPSSAGNPNTRIIPSVFPCSVHRLGSIECGRKDDCRPWKHCSHTVGSLKTRPIPSFPSQNEQDHSPSVFPYPEQCWKPGNTDEAPSVYHAARQMKQSREARYAEEEREKPRRREGKGSMEQRRMSRRENCQKDKRNKEEAEEKKKKHKEALLYEIPPTETGLPPVQHFNWPDQT